MARKGSMKSVIVVGGVLAVLAGGAVAYQTLKPAPSEAAARASTADLARAEMLSFDITTTATGELEARRSVELRSQVENQTSIVEVVPEGTFVRAGTMLVVLQSEGLRTELREEELRLLSSEAYLVAAESGYDIQVSQNQSRLEQAQVRLRLAELSLQQWLEGDDRQRLQDLELDLERAQIDLDRTQNLFTRKEQLYAEEFLSSDELEQERIRLVAARAALSKAQLAQQSYQEFERERMRVQYQSDVDQARAEVERVESQNKIELASREAVRFHARRQLEMRREEVADLRTQIESCEIKAPTDGLVVYATSIDRGQRWGQQGQSPLMVGRQVFPNESLIVLPDTSEMLAKVRVHESLAGRVRRAQEVDIKIDALPGMTFTGVVESIGVLAEGSDWRDPNRREYTVRASIRAPEGVELKPSMRADATITLGRVDNALAVPIQAVFSEGMVRFVYVPRGSKFVRVPVQIGRRSELYAEVTAGITTGTPVLIREPNPAEVISEPWRPEQLKAVGLEIDENGAVVPIGGMPAMMRGPGGPGTPGGQPGMNTPSGGPQGAPGGGRGDGARGPRGDDHDGGDGQVGSRQSAGQGEEAAQPVQTPAAESAQQAQGTTEAAQPQPATPAPAGRGG